MPPRSPFKVAAVGLIALLASCDGEVFGGLSGGSTGPRADLIAPAPIRPINFAALVKPSPFALRAMSNREYLASVSDLIGVELPLSLIQPWTPTPQYSGFDAIGWANFDTKLVRDRLTTIEPILAAALTSTKVMTCIAASPSQLEYSVCAQSIVTRLAERAFRRPLAAAELALLKKAYDDGVALARGNFSTDNELLGEGVRAALSTVFLAPQFMVKAELAPAPGFVGDRDLTPYELASRLSFFLTNSVPDDELWAAAKDGSLSSPDVLARHAERLLTAHPDRFVENFVGQWFGFRELATATDPLEQAMFQESRLTLREILASDLPANTIVNPRFTYLNQRLATHYGVPGAFTTAFQRVASAERGGILAQASVLKLTSNSTAETSPIRRGRWVQERLLCKAIPLPPPELAALISASSMSIPATATVKERLQMHHNAGPACNGCHQYMDPIGLGLEGFDPLGKKRTVYPDGRRVETDSVMFGSPFAGFEGLNELLAGMPDVQRCAGEKLAVHALGRVIGNTGADRDLVSSLTTSESGDPMSFRQIVVRLVRSTAFRKISHLEATP